MKIAIVGAGAIGGYLGVRLAATGDDVTFIARGATLERIRSSGVSLTSADGTTQHARNVRAFDKMSDAGPHDVVLLTLKAHQVSSIAPDLGHLCHSGTSIVTMQNGIPWWYFYKHGGPYDGLRIEASDPGGLIYRHIDPARVIGTVVFPAAVATSPGVIKVIEGNRFTMGEPDGSESTRVMEIAQRLVGAGFKAPVVSDIRSEIWLKLWGNLTFNPISALTHATLVDICKFPLTRTLATQMMGEAQTVAEKLGITFRVPIARRIAGAEGVGAHKTSMLQDVEQGRAIELEALVGSVVELGELTGTRTPHISTVFACASLLSHTLNTQHGLLRLSSHA